jgi:hypothetical protein
MAWFRSVSAANRSLWGQDFQKRVTSTDPGTSGYLANWWDYHASAIDSKPIPLVINDGYQAACDAMMALRAVDARAPLHRRARQVRAQSGRPCPRDVSALRAHRGKNCRVVSVRPRPTDRAVRPGARAPSAARLYDGADAQFFGTYFYGVSPVEVLEDLEAAH